MSDFGKLKQLKTQLNKLRDELAVLKLDVANKQRDCSTKINSIKNIEELIDKLENGNKTIAVSDHAIMRYFERVKGFNIDDIKKEILSQEVKDLIDKLGGDGKYPNGEHQVVLKNNIVTTII